MPVEFSCPRCQQRLQTPDGSQGKPTRCPNCGHSFEVPWAVESHPPSGPLPPTEEAAAPEDSENPFSAPTSVSEPPVAAVTGPLTQRPVFYRDILNLTWETLRTQLGQCLLLGLLMIAVYSAGYIVSLVLSSLMTLFTGLGANPEAQMIATVGVGLLQFVWGQVYGAFLTSVALRFVLNLLRGSREPIQGVFDVLPLLLRVILVQLVIGLLAGLVAGVAAILVGVPIALMGAAFGQGPQLIPMVFLLTLIPLAILVWLFIWVRFSVALPLVVDRNLSVSEALSESFRYTRGNTAAILGATLVVSILSGAFALVTCGIGVVLSIPVWVLCRGVVYLLVTGQLHASQDPLADPMGDTPFSRNASANPFAADNRDQRLAEGPINPNAPLQ